MPKYISIDTIPAKVFFTILQSKDYQLLKPKPKEKGLDAIFISIYDDFFLKSDNAEAKRYLELTKQISFLEYKISTLKGALHFYYYNKTTEQMRIDFAKALKEGYSIDLDLTVPFADEVLRVLNIEIGIIKNDLTTFVNEFESNDKKSKNNVFDFESEIVAMEGVIERQIKDGVKLDKYIAYQKQSKRIYDNRIKAKK